MKAIIRDFVGYLPRGVSRRWSWTQAASLVFTGATAFFLAGMFLIFLWQSLPVWRAFGSGYLTGTKWFFRQQEFGALPMLYGTLVVSTVALLLAAPVGVGSAVFVSEMAGSRLRLPLKLLIELLAGVPSVIFGLLGILFLRTWVYEGLSVFNPLSGDTLLTAGILLAVMILPTIMTVTDDALRGVPGDQRQASMALGATRAETIFYILIPQARKGILAAILLALGRGLGETIAVFLVIGRRDNVLPETIFSLHPLIESGQTLTSKLGGSEANIAYGDPLHWAAIVGLGLLLLTIVTLLTGLGSLLMGSGREHA